MPGPCRTLDEVVARLAAIEEQCQRQGDARSVFATLYGVVSSEIRRRVSEGFFHDNEWVRLYAVTFANLYFDAFDRAEGGRLAEVPKAWRLCFDAAASGRTLVLQNLLLGVNAHVNNDLPLALTRISIDPDRDARYRDHAAVNEVLGAVTERATERITALYAPGIRQLDEAAGELDELMGQFSLQVGRDNAWEAAVSLSNARSDMERRLVSTMTSSRAALMARLLRAASLSPTLIAACRQLERGVALETFFKA
jgi:hypothetical protein